MHTCIIQSCVRFLATRLADCHMHMISTKCQMTVVVCLYRMVRTMHAVPDDGFPNSLILCAQVVGFACVTTVKLQLC